jgi:putative transposase
MAWPKEVPAQRYPSDLTDEEWEILKEALDKIEPYTTGRPRKVNLREILNAIYYFTKTGCQWRYLPKDFPSYSLVSYYYQKWVHNGTWEKLNMTLRQQLRKKTVGVRTPVPVSLTPKVLKEPRNRLSSPDLMGASSSKVESDIL